MPRVRTASLDTVPAGQLTAAFVTMHLATDDVADVMEFMQDKKAVWTKNQKAIDLSYRATLGTAGSGDYRFDLYVEHAPASTGVFAEVAGSRVSGGKGT